LAFWGSVGCMNSMPMIDTVAHITCSTTPHTTHHTPHTTQGKSFHGRDCETQRV
jgi:hypothetical protein